MSEGRRRRVSYMLRLWQAEQDGALVWRASLESVYDRFGQPGECRGFACLAELYAFLDQEIAQSANTNCLNQPMVRAVGQVRKRK